MENRRTQCEHGEPDDSGRTVRMGGSREKRENGRMQGNQGDWEDEDSRAI